MIRTYCWSKNFLLLKYHPVAIMVAMNKKDNCLALGLGDEPGSSRFRSDAQPHELALPPSDTK